MHAEERWTLGRMHHPVRGLLHGSAALVSVVAAVLLWVHGSGGASHKFALGLFGAALVALYTVSSLYHSVPWPDQWKVRMQRADHSMIFVFIAATYTPFGVIVFDGWLQWFTLGMAWGIAAVGVATTALVPGATRGWSIGLNATLGWLAVILIAPTAQRLPWTAIALMFLGGAAYTIGMVFLVTGRPRLWPRVFSYHEAFHVLVILGTAAHFAVTFRYVARFGGA